MSFYSSLPSVQNESSALSSYHPTLFEIVSSQEIDDLLPASLRYILTKYWITNYPSRFSITVNNYFDEWFSLLLKGSIEWFHIYKYNSTFVDKYYGLQKFNNSNKVRSSVYIDLISRGKLSEWPKLLQLKKGQRIIIWLQKVIFPYLTNKIDDYQKKLINSSLFNEVTDWQKLFLKIYPILKKLILILNLAVKFTFISGTNNSINLLDYLFNISYVRTIAPLNNNNGDIYDNITLGQGFNKRIDFNNITVRSIIKNMILNAWQGVAFTGSQVFPTFMFMLKVYQWWISQDLTAKLQKRINNIDKEIPRPPLNTADLETLSDSNCIICKNIIQNPAVIETGYVMCYPCAVMYLKEHDGECPVTHRKLIQCVFDKNLNEWDVSRSVRKLLI
ncbi:similar to Saccharomyces cerevisiae YMR026C PEX12 C3HC4-type RING-finger peroxin and E3 ubiquitin ligase, required for peroxisome biogenesis and peroxisomal matrix protein import [Maudiozyma barnettii]|uniref:Peroxisome assembly protein 12 n=1 Tax=Maudiozyma barnettii TaxID=61262 RepID=A0A8H2VK53_9SACH|nr:ubiquitin-protein ligase peroxin 12 [Kazachstania barnettii]CAB4256911.1 similar to Saccharomyces cerevisiae YMR026C PEX12 C3HC4-type RING-finger peroxin and E3 ubiquitin ligase, required for peroxisome biogenesis and peroxisomal matrix protein import [Kazachstania barnettii]CAD1785516.1 similar to Saccharomyces cerevisiae YMR026C PEX12 C3HC4-type RING-finger peroxin and E3 ubiquitin ligase, required for peroxisome biogenesis and peroxisomal matrix protein import [Kazachstania barnettii]